MGKSKSKRPAHRFDTKKVDFDGNLEKNDFCENLEKSGLFSVSVGIPGSGRSASIGDAVPADGCAAGRADGCAAVSADGRTAGNGGVADAAVSKETLVLGGHGCADESVDGHAAVSVDGHAADDGAATTEETQIFDCAIEGDDDADSSGPMASIDYPDSSAARDVEENDADEVNGPIRVWDDLNMLSDDDGALTVQCKGQDIRLNVKKDATAGEKVAAILQAGLTGVVCVDGVDQDFDKVRNMLAQLAVASAAMRTPRGDAAAKNLLALLGTPLAIDAPGTEVAQAVPAVSCTHSAAKNLTELAHGNGTGYETETHTATESEDDDAQIIEASGAMEPGSVAQDGAAVANDGAGVAHDGAGSPAVTAHDGACTLAVNAIVIAHDGVGNQESIAIDVGKDATFEEKLCAFRMAGHDAKSVTINGIVVDLAAMDANIKDQIAHGSNGARVAALNEPKSVGNEASNSGSDENKAKKSWAGIVKTNRHPDEDVIELERENIGLDDDDTLDLSEEDCREDSIEKLSLVGFFSKFPGRNAVHRMVNSWPRRCSYHYHNSGWIIFTFSSEDDALEVLQRGPYRPYGMPLTLKRMPAFFNFSIQDHSVVPLWIQMPNLPLRFWSKKGLGKICSQVGKPLHTDKMTATARAPSFARCLVDVDVSKPLRTSLNLRPPKGKKFKQHILYEHVPRYCSACKRLGHLSSDCKGVDHVVTPLYVPKNDKYMRNKAVAVAKQFERAAEEAEKKASIAKRGFGTGTEVPKNNPKAAEVKSGAFSKSAEESGAVPKSAEAKSGAVPKSAEVKSGAEPKPGAAGETSSAVVGQTVPAVGKTGPVVGRTDPVVEETVLTEAEWKDARGHSNKGNKFVTPEKGVAKKPLISPGTYDVLSEEKKKKKNKNKSRKNKKKKDHG